MTTSSFSDDDRFVARYVAGSPNYAADAPTLAASLDVFAGMGGVPPLLQGLGPASHPLRCLIQGYTAPGNAAALRRFLQGTGSRRCCITAVDRLDLACIYARLGIAMPEMTFIQGDAADLAGRLREASFDLLVQDFILNCAPPRDAASLLSEAARLLRPGGLALLSFTDSSGLSESTALTEADVAANWQLRWNPEANSLAALAGGGAEALCRARGLIGAVVKEARTTTPGNGRYTCITAPDGGFEFFVPAEETFAALAAAGFTTLLTDQRRGRDYNGLHCNRWRCVVRRAGAWAG